MGKTMSKVIAILIVALGISGCADNTYKNFYHPTKSEAEKVRDVDYCVAYGIANRKHATQGGLAGEFQQAASRIANNELCLMDRGWMRK